MRIVARILLLIMLCSAIAPANATQETKPQESKPQETKAQDSKESSSFRPPMSVSDLLDVCGEAVNQLDSPPTQVPPVKIMKFGWCMGWAQALHERIAEVHIYARFEDMNAKKEGRPPRAYEGPDKDYLNVCLPPDNRVPDLIRAMVKGLRETPMQLHEPKNGPVKAALKKAYPCPAP
jgi:hypothetical protein